MLCRLPPQMQLWVRMFFSVVVGSRRRRRWWRRRRKGRNSLASHSNSEKCQLRLSLSSSLLIASVICGAKWMKKAILEQILDIPCRSILIRSSKNYFAAAYLLGRLSLAVHLFTHEVILERRQRRRRRRRWHEWKTFLLLIDH